MTATGTIRLGVLGRHHSMLDAALRLAKERGIDALGTIDDAEAMGWIGSGRIDALSIGGGVEAASRERLLAACADAGVRALEVYGLDGPNGLTTALDGLRSTR